MGTRGTIYSDDMGLHVFDDINDEPDIDQPIYVEQWTAGDDTNTLFTIELSAEAVKAIAEYWQRREKFYGKVME